MFRSMNTANTPVHPRLAAVVLLGTLAIIVAVGAVALFGWDLEISEVRTLLGILLPAQAAIMALTFVITVFAIENVTAKRDADNRTHREYVRQTGMRPSLWGGVGAVLVTGALLIAGTLCSAGAPYLLIFASAAGAVNLALPVWLFERVARLAEPGHWRAIRLDLFRADVRSSVQAFRVRTESLQTAGGYGIDATFPGPDEWLADVAVRRLLDDARRAMDEHRQDDVEKALASIRELLKDALDQLEHVWLSRGLLPTVDLQMPLVATLREALYPFREYVFSESRREHLSALWWFDHQILREAACRRRVNFFREAFGGYEDTYKIACQAGNSQVREWLQRGYWSQLPIAISQNQNCMEQAIRHQERLLSQAMRAQDLSTFVELNMDFGGVLLIERQHGRGLDIEKLDRLYRIALLGLGGLAILLAKAGRLDDPQPYLDVVRNAHSEPQQLAHDVVQAVAIAESNGHSGYPLWWEWETAEDSPPGGAVYLEPQRYPLTFFSMRLLELADEPIPILDLGEKAQQIREWFAEDVYQVGVFAQPPLAELEATLRRRRALAALGDVEV